MLNSHDVCIVVFQNVTKFQFPPPLHSNLKITSWIFPSLRANNPTHPLLNPPCFPWFAQGPTPGASLWHVHHAHHLPHFSWPYRTPILITQSTILLSHYIHIYDWLILLRIILMRKSREILSGKSSSEWCNKKWISSTQSMWSFVRKVLWKDCSQNEVDLSSLKTLLSLLT